VGPIRVGYGTVVAAGSVLLDDVLEDGRLVAAAPPPGFTRERRPHTYRNLVRVARNNVIYLANLVALEGWYRQIREPFFARQEMGPLVYAGALEMLTLAKEERIKRLTAMAAKVSVTTSEGRAFSESADAVCALFEGQPATPDGTDFVGAFQQASTAAVGNYLETVQRLTPELRAMGIQWLERIVAALCDSADGLLGPMDLFGRRG
jgi:hypothetical protein